MRKLSFLFALSSACLLTSQAFALSLTSYVAEWSGYTTPGGYPAYSFDGSYPNDYNNITPIENKDMRTKAQQANVLAFAFMQAWNPKSVTDPNIVIPADWKGQLHFDDVWGDLPDNRVSEYANWMAICKASSLGTCAAIQKKWPDFKNAVLNFQNENIGHMNNFGAFLNLNTAAKKILALGGANTPENHSLSAATYAAIYSEANAAKPFNTFETSLQSFINAVNAKAQVDYQKLKGIDFDFEPPIDQNGNLITPDDATLMDYKNLYNLVMQTRAVMGPDFYISVTLTMSKDYVEKINQSVEGGFFKEISAYADAVNLMTYDMHGPWSMNGDPGTLPHVLFSMPEGLSHSYAVNYGTKEITTQVLAYGIPASKLQIGVATYGRGFSGVAATNHGLDQSWTGPSMVDASYSNQVGFLPYASVPLLLNQGYQHYVMKDAAGAVIGDYIYSEAAQQFIGYQSTDSVQVVCDYEKATGLQGTILWSMDTDTQDASSLASYYHQHCAS